MKVLALVGLCVVAVVCRDSAPQGLLIAVRNGGITKINQIVEVDNTRYTNAYNSFKSAEAICNQKVNEATNNCVNCVNQRCEARAKSACEPNVFEKVLGKTIELGKKIGGVVTKTLNPKNLVKPLKKIANPFKDAGKAVVNVGKKVVNVVKDIGGSIGRAFRRWGKRSLRGTHTIRARRAAPEPSCNDLKGDASQACQAYADPHYCSVCGFNAMRDCPNYANVVNALQDAERRRAWMEKAGNQNYDVISVTWDGGWNNVQAVVNIFGRQFTVNVGNGLNVYQPNFAEILANKAVETFKSA